MKIGREDGIALVIAVMATLLMMALGGALVLTTSSEMLIADNFRHALEGLYAADAAMERTMDDLPTVVDWRSLLDGSTTSALIDGPPHGQRTLPDGSQLDLDLVRDRANCPKISACSASDLSANTSAGPLGASNPAWQLYSYGPLSSMLPAGSIQSSYYVVTMVADGPSGTDGDPSRESEDHTGTGPTVLSFRVEAFGLGGAHKAIEMTAARAAATALERPASGVRILSWRETW